MKLVYLIACITISGCAKTLDYTAVLPSQGSFRINKMRIRESPQSMRTIVFLYDHRNRLIVRKEQETGRVLEQFIYDGSELKSVVEYNESGNIAYVNENPLYSKDFGNIMEFYLLTAATQTALDTNNILYHFKDSRIFEVKHRLRPGGLSVEFDDRRYFTYDAMNNLSVYMCTRNGTPVLSRKIITTDNHPNPLKHLSKLLFIFGDLPMHSGMGDHNVTSYEENGNVVELEYTYGKNGFPTSIRNKAEDFVRYEFEYGE